MEGIKIDGNVFYRRIEKIHRVWKSEVKLFLIFIILVQIRKYTRRFRNSQREAR